MVITTIPIKVEIELKNIEYLKQVLDILKEIRKILPDIDIKIRAQQN